MKAQETITAKPTNIIKFVRRFPDEKSCRDYLADSRWGSQPVCPHCGFSAKIYRINDGKLYRCAKCMKQFTVRVGTIFEDSALPLQKWFMAIYILTAHRKGISSCQLARDIEVTQKTAWFMLHRIRYAVSTKSFEKKLTGTIEADESYFGGEEKNKHFDKRIKAAHNGGTNGKTAVFGIVQRGGIVTAHKIERVNKKTTDEILKAHVHPDSTIITDDWKGYKDLDVEFLHHYSVNHSKKEYVRGRVHTNNIEGFWSLMKRGIHGTYHQVSKKHLQQYADEYAYRYNSRKETDIDRFMEFLAHCAGRLTHKRLVG